MNKISKFASVLGALLALVMVTFTATSASAQAPASQVRIGGVGFSSLGTGALDLTPGVESVILLNYAYSSKNLKGYHLTDRAGNVVPMCATSGPTTVFDCESATADADADGVVNLNDADTWITLTARSQLSINVEARNDGPWLNDGGDTVYLKNSVGRVLTKFVYSVTNPTS